MFKQLAVIPVLVVVRRADFFSTRQDLTENTRSFAAIIQLKASIDKQAYTQMSIKCIKQNFCNSCNLVAPSNPRLPPIEPLIRKVPFKSIVCDYFQFKEWY